MNRRHDMDNRNNNERRPQSEGNRYGSSGRDYESSQYGNTRSEGWGRSSLRAGNYDSDRYANETSRDYESGQSYSPSYGNNYSRGYGIESTPRYSGADYYQGDNQRFDSDRNDRDYSRDSQQRYGSDSSTNRGMNYGPDSSHRGMNYSSDYGYTSPFGSSRRESYGSSSENYGTRGSNKEQGFFGNFFGKGPKGYKRSDERIREDVSEALYHHSAIDASEIEVTVEEGVVTLKGTVDEKRAKRLAEDAAEACSGVKDVKNEIRVSSRTEDRDSSMSSRSSQSSQSKDSSRTGSKSSSLQ